MTTDPEPDAQAVSATGATATVEPDLAGLSADELEAEHPGAVVSDPRRWSVLVVLCLSLLIVGIDGTIVNVALPTLVRELERDRRASCSGSSTPTRSSSPACCSSPATPATGSAASGR